MRVRTSSIRGFPALCPPPEMGSQVTCPPLPRTAALPWNLKRGSASTGTSDRPVPPVPVGAEMIPRSAPYLPAVRGSHHHGTSGGQRLHVVLPGRVLDARVLDDGLAQGLRDAVVCSLRAACGGPAIGLAAPPAGTVAGCEG